MGGGGSAGTIEYFRLKTIKKPNNSKMKIKHAIEINV